ncbi:hypothetical protein AGABI2DRAFT_121372 [Agaricus bisporus var. bisporus H97]|uniref:hypothetical protein n=1 Tax=Agaricus bisporus var. bisporus (strain H97 / ATCC MYA-4626 / FGSC 10389) TaxID=936046 RepID=UPI00029F6C01|nr:hypothetical protein AGABI2DRAFT_121372 [Agaricus bisporus var. bisporus H97]EKV44179.1 hypothetical protein AGABI2DRAFT_121372 [Agaricus bisporus var. bisporus H97]
MSHGVPAPEEEIDAYTVEELEKWVFRRNRAQALWAGISKNRFRTRIVNLPDYPINSSCYCKLIPGGRWLLVGYSNATMYVIDLEDATSLTSHLLCDPGEFYKNLCETGNITYNFWVNPSKSRLSLRIAGCVTESFSDARTFVYQVDLVGHGSAATLIARPYAYFPNRGPGYRSPSFGLNERYVVNHWREDDDEGPAAAGQLQVYDYSAKVVEGGEDQPMSSDSNPIICNLSGSFFNAINFVHDDTFVVLGTSPDAVYVLEINPITRSITLLHTIIIETSSDCDLWWSDIVGFPGSSESRMVFLGYNPTFLRGIVIPHHKNIPATKVEFAEVQSDWNQTPNLTALGLSVSLFFQSDWLQDVGLFRIFSQSWDISQPNQLADYFSVDYESMNDGFELASFDQNIGRVAYIVYDGSTACISVVDLV